jgi:KDO2-lipid IV(A) lauroyltransferase
VEHSPGVIGLCAALALPSSRRASLENLRRIRGRVGPVREAVDVARTFSSYAGCLAEALSNGSKNAALPDLEISGRPFMEAALAEKKGVIVVTAHTAGWEIVGPVFKKHRGLDVVMVMEAERDNRARELHDAARRNAGLEVVHVGADPFASLPILRRLREGAAVALQIDRVPEGMRGVPVTLFGQPSEIPEGPLRLAQVSGAPIVPVFCARLGYRSYFAEMYETVHVPRRPEAGVLEATAQRLADAMGDFVARHPTQWLHWGDEV